MSSGCVTKVANFGVSTVSYFSFLVWRKECRLQGFLSVLLTEISVWSSPIKESGVTLSLIRNKIRRYATVYEVYKSEINVLDLRERRFLGPVFVFPEKLSKSIDPFQGSTISPPTKRYWTWLCGVCNKPLWRSYLLKITL